MQLWFLDLITECLHERGFRAFNHAQESLVRTQEQESTGYNLIEQFSHSSCTQAVFTFIWVEVSDHFVTGTGMWALHGERGCTSISRLSKICPNERQNLKCQIVDRLLLPCLYSCQSIIYGFVKEGLVALPQEVLKKILRYLPASSLCSVAAVHCVLYSASNDSTLWKSLYSRDFPINSLSYSLREVSNGLRANWRERYKTAYLARQREHFKRDRILQVVSVSDLSQLKRSSLI